MTARYPLVIAGTQIEELQTGDTIILPGATSGTITLTPAAVAGTTTITLPAVTGTVVTTGDTGSVTSAMIADGAIVNGDISASAAIAVSKLAASTISGITLGSNLNTLTLGVSGTGLSGSTTYNGSATATFTVTSNATNANTASTIVSRDASGNFSAGTITASLNGTATTATNIAGGVAGAVHYQSASGTTGFTAAGTSGQVLTSAGTGAPTFSSTLTNISLTTPTITGTKETKIAMGANDISLSSGNYFSKTISGATTLTVSSVPATGTAISFILDLTNGGSAAVTWWTGVKWASGTAPTLTSAGRDVLGFFTHDGGTTWTGLVLGKDVK